MKSVKKRKRYAVLLLEQTARPVEPEERLAFAVIRQAVEDIGLRDQEEMSDDDWWDGALIPWCDVLGLDYEYVCRVLHDQELLPQWMTQHHGGLLVARNGL